MNLKLNLKFVSILFKILIISSCSHKENKNTTERIQIEMPKTEVLDLNSDTFEVEMPLIAFNDEYSQPLKLQFNEFYLEFDSLSYWDESKELEKIQKDTALVYVELGENLGGRKFRIRSPDGYKFKVFQRLENSITVQNEGPHCDLIDWKHYVINWSELKEAHNEYEMIAYTDAESEKFEEVDLNELKIYVKQFCGESWAELVKDANSIYKYPFGVSTSRVFLKVELTNPNSGKTIERYVVFELPMGC